MSGVRDGRGGARLNGISTTTLSCEVTSGVVRLLPDLRAFARTLALDRASADDLAQEAIARALANAHRFKRGTNFKAWIFTILRNCYFNEYRKRRRRHCSIDDLPPLVQLRVPPTQHDYLEMCDVRRAFALLRPHQREVLMLVGPGDLNYEEAAKVVGCPLGTVKSRVSRARRDLLRILEKVPVTVRKDVPSAAGRFADELLRMSLLPP